MSDAHERLRLPECAITFSSSRRDAMARLTIAGLFRIRQHQRGLSMAAREALLRASVAATGQRDTGYAVAIAATAVAYVLSS